MVLTWIILACALAAAPGPGELEKAMLAISGAASVEELDESEVERFLSLSEHPVDLNAASAGRLRATGLLSEYQCAALCEYRRRFGDILSFAELASVDGIGAETAATLRPFVLLRSRGAPARRDGSGCRQELMLRGGGKIKEGNGAAVWGLKYHIGTASRAEFNYSNRSTYSDTGMHPGTISAAYYGKRALEQLVVGDFNIRWGQGLIAWSGFSMSGVSSASAVRKNGSGITATSSFSPAMRGAAADFVFGHGLSLSGALHIAGLREKMDGKKNAATGWQPMLHASYCGRNASFGLSGAARFNMEGRAAGSAAFDWSAGWSGLCFFGELAWSGAPAALTGIVLSPSYGNKYALAARWYSEDFDGKDAGALRSASKICDEAGVSLAAQGKWYSAALDCVYHPSSGKSQYKLKAGLSHSFRIADSLHIEPSLKISSRYSSASGWRNEIRADASLVWKALSLSGRYDILRCAGTAWLWYAEAGYSRKFKSFLRWTLFKIDKWDDRIYCYERDSPGNFNVPAYYGRGFSISLFAGYKYETGGVRHNSGLRVSCICYPWNLTPKASEAELKLQYSINF